MKNTTKKVIMYASNFSKYGKVQAMKSTLEFLAKDAGHRFVFINDPARGDFPKVNFDGGTVRLGVMQAKEINFHLAQLEDIHAK